MPKDYHPTLYPLTNEDVEMLWECLGLSDLELEDMKEDYEQTQAESDSPTR